MNHFPPCPSTAVAQRRVNKEVVKKSGKRCSFCGGHFHPRYSCPGHDATCFSCGKPGHFARVCQSKTGYTVNPHLLRLSFPSHRSKNRILLALTLVSNRLWLTSLRMLGYLVSYKTLKPDPERLQALFDLPIPSSAKELKHVCGMFAYYARWIPNFSQKARPLLLASHFPLGPEAERAFAELKSDLGTPASALFKRASLSNLAPTLQILL